MAAVHAKFVMGSFLTAAFAAGCEPAPASPPSETSTAWAYPMSPRAATVAPAVDSVSRLSVPGAEVTFTMPQLKNLFDAPDWRPGEHATLPRVVAIGRKPDVMACGFCHLPSGNGRPENASLAGLPREYIVQQMLAFRNGDRRSSVNGRVPTEFMAKSAKAATDSEIASAADYFSAQTRQVFTKVVETDRVPKTMAKGWLYSSDPAGGSEPIGARVIEMPEDFERFERRDPATRYVAYVPSGSIEKGADLAKTWGAGKQACASCHGIDLHGAGNVPPLAGRSPTYIVRQLNDFRTGARHGLNADRMKPVVASMRNEDMVALAAFLGSR